MGKVRDRLMAFFCWLEDPTPPRAEDDRRYHFLMRPEGVPDEQALTELCRVVWGPGEMVITGAPKGCCRHLPFEALEDALKPEHVVQVHSGTAYWHDEIERLAPVVRLAWDRWVVHFDSVAKENPGERHPEWEDYDRLLAIGRRFKMNLDPVLEVGQ